MVTINEISPDIYYVGVNDRRPIRFESLWAIPYGVSYNSYIVRGDKTALIDTVEVEFADNLINHLDSLNVVPDYLIINHMEPDHSGSIPYLTSKYPSMKIVGNKLTMGMIKGYYHFDDETRLITVSNGDTIDLGNGMVFTFYLTPLVHWPETMMTWLDSKGILFSGDAFGCFGALPGEIIDSAIDTSMYFSEMYRYYASIVGKYGKNVQSALSKLSGFEIKYICSTHGPIWHKEIAKVINIYDTLSKYNPISKDVVIVYGSMYGNTEVAVQYLAEKLFETGVKNVALYDAANVEMSEILSAVWKAKGLVIAAPTYSMDIYPPVDSFIKALEVRELKNRKLGLIGSYTWVPESMRKMKNRFDNLDVDIVGTVTIKMSLDDDSRQQLNELALSLSAKLRS